MKIVWTRQSIFVTIAAIVLVIGFFFFLFLNVVEPTRMERERVLHNLESERQILSELNQQLTTHEDLDEVKSSVLLQQRLPVNALLDQLLLALTRAEGVSETYLTSIVVEDSESSDFLEEAEENTASTIFPEINDQFEGNSVSTEQNSDMESLPFTIDGIHTVRLRVMVRANTYEGLARFIEEVDQLDRIMNIDSISYVSPREQMRVEDTIDSLEFMIVLSAFYFPELAEGLQEEMPLIDYPRPVDKRSPLY